MRNRPTLILGAGVAVCGLAAAGESNWRVVVWTDPLTVSIDTASISAAAQADLVTARVLWDYTNPQKTQGNSAATYRSMIGLVVFDCATDRFGGASGVSYAGDDGAGAVVSRYAVDPSDTRLSNVAPGTVGRDMLALVCASAKEAE